MKRKKKTVSRLVMKAAKVCNGYHEHQVTRMLVIMITAMITGHGKATPQQRAARHEYFLQHLAELLGNVEAVEREARAQKQRQGYLG